MDKIRIIVVKWYEENCLEKEIESFDYDLSKKEDRLKLFILGVFFNCVFQEEKALKIFSEMEKRGYLVFDELDNFETNIKNVMRELERETGRSWKVLKLQNMIDSVQALEEIFAEIGRALVFHLKINTVVNVPLKFVVNYGKS